MFLESLRYKLKKHFKEFKGTKSKKKSKAVEEGMFFIKDKYTSLFKDAERTCDELTIHDTCAVDTGIMEGVLNKVLIQIETTIQSFTTAAVLC